MATSSRQSALFGLQDWKRLYQSYRDADFQAYDYDTLRKSFIDYLTTYYPETFNDYIESSEFVALLDVIAYMGQALAFRDDLNARENFIDTAERRDSVIKLANLVSYTPKRNIAGQGLLKVQSISTTESILDINGVNLSNVTVLWNDAANQNWQEQFNTVINATLVSNQRIGRPGNTNSILGIKTDEYSIAITSDQTPVVPFRSEIDALIMDFELVSVTSVNSESLYELPPAPTNQFNMVYRNDKLGFGSPNTGFFFYFKQGTLQAVDFRFAEAIQNNLQPINVEGINNTDTWLYQLDDNGQIQNLWTQVATVYADANLQGNNARRVFSVASRFNDQVTYQFGDGVFGEVPVGLYRAYVRSGNAQTYTISPSEMQGVVVNIPYISRTNRVETLTITLSLQTTVNTALQREPLSAIKQRAPARYYVQNRMVNGEDYSNFPYTLYNSIIKSTAVNRSSIGVSRNLDLLDPTFKYSSANVFADDGALYTDNQSGTVTFSTSSINIALEFLSQTLSVLLSDTAAIQYYQQNYPRYTGYYPGGESVNNYTYWNESSVSGKNVTGYFYINSSGGELPVSSGPSSSYTMKYITNGALLKFLASPDPVSGAPRYFDSNNRLQTGVPNLNAGDKLSIWVSVTNVVGDGKNFGSGNFSNGTGPVTLNSYVPTGAYLDPTVDVGNLGSAIIPSFDNTLDSTVVDEIIGLIRNEQDFSLIYDNSKTIVESRWSVAPVSDAMWFVKFEYNSINQTYLVTIRNTNYYFGSVSEVRFVFDTINRVYDPKSGQVLSDFVNVIRTNNNATLSGTLGVDYILNVTAQPTLSDGYPNDYQVKVSSINPINDMTTDPDFFTNIVGTSSTAYVFFELFNDVQLLTRQQLLPPGVIIYAYATQNLIEDIMYEYPAGTVFYATSENVFYQTQQQIGITPPILLLNDVSSSYAVKTGRGAINFQYRHNSGNTTRIDPATTNIIDLYLVTQAYYTQYQNWINDSTGTIPEPSKPTMSELQQQYNAVDDFKMLSDSVVLNSVTFKPLFGTKASPALQGKIKVIKSLGTTASDSQIRSSVLAALNSYFTLDKWDFGDTFYFSELTAYLHIQLAGLISSVVLVPNDPNQTFGDLYEIRSAANEIFVNGATVTDIIVISALTPQALQRSV